MRIDIAKCHSKNRVSNVGVVTRDTLSIHPFVSRFLGNFDWTGRTNRPLDRESAVVYPLCRLLLGFGDRMPLQRDGVGSIYDLSQIRTHGRSSIGQGNECDRCSRCRRAEGFAASVHTIFTIWLLGDVSESACESTRLCPKTRAMTNYGRLFRSLAMELIA